MSSFASNSNHEHSRFFPLKTLTILGSTGSIGQSTLDIVRIHRESFRIFALTCNNNVEVILNQASEFQPEYLVCNSEVEAKRIKDLLPRSVKSKVLHSRESLNFVASHNDVTHVIAAISGSAGLESTYHAAKSEKEILLANKESMVMAGPLIMHLIKSTKATIIPLDSEHNAIYQVMKNKKDKFIKKIILTASGGPFLNNNIQDMEFVSVEDALNHPNWTMGQKVTIDSATMMNKGLEVIEASYLFDLSEKKIDVLIHPQSIIHSFVEYIDGSYIAQMGNPDMRIPISYALGYPGRISSGVNDMDLTAKKLSFLNPDTKKFPCLRLAYDALALSHNYCVALNASNEVAVNAFLNKKIRFLDIYKINSELLNQITSFDLASLEDIFLYNEEIRFKCLEVINKLL